jgi:hypothetical protein
VTITQPEIEMDGAPKSKRLYPAYTTEKLYDAVKSPHLSNDQRDRLQLAIRQRDPMSADYVERFVVPQIK